MQTGVQFASGGVLDPLQQPAQQAEGGGDYAAGGAGVLAFGQDFDAQHAWQHAAQGAGHPKLVVVAALRVQAHNQVRPTDGVPQGFDIEGQIEAAALLAAFYQDHAAAMRQPRLLQGGDGGEGSE